jgi:GT2 family glycosyltransferase
MGVDSLMNEDTIKLDIVIPSFRADVAVLNSIRNLPIPKNMIRKIIVVLDDPLHPLPRDLDAWSAFDDLIIIRNEVNLGASGARNRGIDAALSDWVLFLDDDIYPEPDLLQVYAKSIEEKGREVPGFVGITRLPETVSSFTKGIVASDILTFFDLAEYRDCMPWGITANLLVRRDAIGDHRFKPLFPKSGGGEDIDFCLEIVNSFGKDFSTEPNAVVHHPWWNNADRTYRRFFRWAYGDSNLPALHPQHRWRNLPNTAELLTLCLLSAILFFFVDESFPKLMILTISGVVIGEFFSEWMRLILVKSIKNPITAIESSCVRFSNDLGRVKAVVQSVKIWRITERFDYAATREWIWGERRWAFFKLACQVSFCVLFWWFI